MIVETTDFSAVARSIMFAFIVGLTLMSMIFGREHRILFAALFLWMAAIIAGVFLRESGNLAAYVLFTGTVTTTAEFLFVLAFGWQLYRHTKKPRAPDGERKERD